MPTYPAIGGAQGTDAVATLPPAMYPRKLIRVNITGPAGSRVELYLGNLSDSAKFDQSARGQSNTADYGSSPQEVPGGMSVYVKWPGQSANALSCSARFTTDR